MATIHYRPEIKIGDCITLSDKSLKLGGNQGLLRDHVRNGLPGFPKPVSRIGAITLYVEAELDAYWTGFIWRQSDIQIAKYMEG